MFMVSYFQVGCLNDSESRGYETLEDAIDTAFLLYIFDEEWEETPTFDGQYRRWQNGTQVVAVEDDPDYDPYNEYEW